jgi:5-methylthioadenosine/S-adenosylhomocysteine deaminase
MAAMTGIVIRDAAVVTVDDDFTVHPRGWVRIENRHIVDLGNGEPLSGAIRSADRVIDAAGCAVMPGMVNGHTHLFQTFFRGLGDDKSLLDWLRDYIWPTARLMTAQDVAAAAVIGLIENLRTGATSVLDHQYIHADPDTDDAICAAAERLGVRYLLARGWADRNYDPVLQETPEQLLGREATLAQRWDGSGSGRIRVETAPLIPWGCSDETMRTAIAASRARGRGFHIHCAETSAEISMSLAERGLRHVPWLEALGVLGPDAQLAHSVWLDDDELDAVARSGATVVHCPVSNMYLASGVPRIAEMRALGVPVALASDGPGSNNRQDLFEAMKLAVLLQKVHHLDPVILQPEHVLHMACRGGARAMGQADELGAVQVGRLADLVVVDLQSVFIAPVHRVPSALVFNATPRDVRHVIVDGNVVIDDGRLTTADERAELRRAQGLCRSLFRRAGRTMP